MIDMTSNKPMTLQQHAMRFGTLMGLFWILKFILLPAGIHHSPVAAFIPFTDLVRTDPGIYICTQV